jgi:hypothetical protein
MTSWDDLNAIDEPASNSITHTIMDVVCVPRNLDDLRTPRSPGAPEKGPAHGGRSDWSGRKQ